MFGLNRSKNQEIDPDDEIILEKPFHGSRLCQVIGRLPEFRGNLYQETWMKMTKKNLQFCHLLKISAAKQDHLTGRDFWHQGLPLQSIPQLGGHQ